MRHGYFLLIILLVTVLSNNLVYGDNSYIKFTLYRDKYVVDISLVGGNGVSSTLISGVIGNRESLTVQLQFYTTSKILQPFLSIDEISVESIRIRAQRYSEFSLYKLNGTITAGVNDKPLELLLVFDILVSNNDSIEEVDVRGTITPVSSSRELSLTALAVVGDAVKRFFSVLENMSLRLIETRRINIEHVPTSRGISVRVDAVLEVSKPDDAWKNIVGNFIDTMIFDYIGTLFDNRLRDYAIGLELDIKNDTLSGNMTVLFDRRLEELLGLNHTILSSDFVITYYETPGEIVLNISNMVLEPRDTLRDSLREIGLFLYRLIGNTSLSVIVASANTRIDARRVSLEPIRWNESYVEWNTSEALLYLDRIILDEESQSFNYLLAVVMVVIASVGLFYVVRRVSWK